MSGGTDPSWGGTNGVPEGWYFLVTDVLVHADTIISAPELKFNIYHISGCDNGIPGGTGLARLVRVRSAADASTFTAHFTSPLHVLPEGSCLRFDGFANNTISGRVHVSGYLTTDPSRFRP
jgi:hypothetical protein